MNLSSVVYCIVYAHAHFYHCHTPMEVKPLRVSQQKDLDVLVTSNLSWSAHLVAIRGKAYYPLNQIRRSIPITSPINLEKHLFISLVRSQHTYCSQAWRPHLIKDIKTFERVQRRARKFILNDPRIDFSPLIFSLLCFDLIF